MISAGIILLCVLGEYAARETACRFLTVSHNPGAAFGIMKGTPGIALTLSGIACAVILGVIYLADMKPLTRIGLSVMAGGALSNFLERVFLGYVVDWIPVPFLDLRYNPADVAISLGALIVFISMSKSRSEHV